MGYQIEKGALTNAQTAGRELGPGTRPGSAYRRHGSLCGDEVVSHLSRIVLCSVGFHVCRGRVSSSLLEEL